MSSQSESAVGMAVLKAAKGSQVLACGHGQVITSGESRPGATYLVGAYVPGMGVPSSSVSLTFDSGAPAPPSTSFTATVDAGGTVDNDWDAVVTGTLSCRSAASAGGQSGGLALALTQTKAGSEPFTAGASMQFGGLCDGAPHPWSIRVSTPNGPFAHGPAQVKLTGQVVTGADGSQTELVPVSADITLN